MRFAYTCLWWALLPVALLRLWWKGRSQPAYRERWLERLGISPPLPARPRLWVHAVSVGETVAAAPLVRQWLKRHPDWAVLVTTTTPTGSAQVRQLFGDAVEHVYLPFDLPPFVHRFLQRCRPTLGVVMETEIWPNLFQAYQVRQIPLLMANARLSDRSFKSYLKLRWLVAPALRQVGLIAARGAADAQRFRTLGASPDSVDALGNLKFDLAIPPSVHASAQAWRAWWGRDRPVWIAASTHPGEEEQVLQAHQRVLEAVPNALLLLAPRHPNRTPEVQALLSNMGLKHGLRSSVPGTPVADTDTGAGPETNVLLIDTLGELLNFYAASDVAFVGGSLVPTGGHNPLEPLTLGKPVISGPQVHNFKEVYAELQALGGVTFVTAPAQLAQAVVAHCMGPETHALPPAVLSWLEANQGSTDRLIHRIEQKAGLPLLSAPPAPPPRRV